jgi:predicted nucleic acid-binding protein
LGLKPIGLLAVLLFAKRTGRLDSVEETMRTLQKDAGFYIASDLFELLLREAGER